MWQRRQNLQGKNLCFLNWFKIGKEDVIRAHCCLKLFLIRMAKLVTNDLFQANSNLSNFHGFCFH